MVEKSTIYATDQKIIGFEYSTGIITVNESSERFLSISEAYFNIISTFKDKINEIERGASILKYKKIEAGKIMHEALGFDFYFDRQIFPAYPPRIIDVKKDKNWHLIFEGANKIKADVTLGDDYKIISVKPLSGKAKKDFPK